MAISAEMKTMAKPIPIFGYLKLKDIFTIPLNKGDIFHTEMGPRLMNWPSESSLTYLIGIESFRKQEKKPTMNSIGKALIRKRTKYGMK